MTGYRIRPLAAAVDAAAFHCGQPVLDDYIRRIASQDVRRGVVRVLSPRQMLTRNAWRDSLH